MPGEFPPQPTRLDPKKFMQWEPCRTLILAAVSFLAPTAVMSPIALFFPPLSLSFSA